MRVITVRIADWILMMMIVLAYSSSGGHCVCVCRVLIRYIVLCFIREKRD